MFYFIFWHYVLIGVLDRVQSWLLGWWLKFNWVVHLFFGNTSLRPRFSINYDLNISSFEWQPKFNPPIHLWGWGGGRLSLHCDHGFGLVWSSSLEWRPKISRHVHLFFWVVTLWPSSGLIMTKNLGCSSGNQNLINLSTFFFHCITTRILDHLQPKNFIT